MNEKTSFTTVDENLVAKPPKLNRQRSSIITLPFIILFITLFLLIFFTVMYIDYLIFPTTFSNSVAYEAIVVSSWTFAIATFVIFIFFRIMFLLSSKRKSFDLANQPMYRIVDELPVDNAIATPIAAVMTNQADSLPLVDATPEEVPELIANVKGDAIPTIEAEVTTTTSNGVSTTIQEIPAEFANCAAWLDQRLQLKGFAQKQASEFLSLMVYSRLLVIAEHPSQSEFLQVINGFFASEGAMIDGTLPTAPLDQQPLLTTVFASAKSKPHLPHLIHLHHVDPKDLPNMLGIFAHYSRFPLQTKTINLSGETYKLPSNLWLIVTLKPATSVFAIPESLRSHLGVYTIQGEKEEPSISTVRVKHEFDWDKASRIFSPTYPSKKLSEDLWKKVDQWVALMHQVSGYVLQNDVTLHLENYVLLGLTLNLEPLVVLDQAFASSLLIHALAKAKPTAYQKETDLERFFESAFGRNTFKQSLTLVRHYLKDSIH